MKQRLVIFFVLMGSYFGFYLAFPLFPTIFLNESCRFISGDTSTAVRSILLGLTYTIYYIGGFIGMPLIGKFSDRIGRKPILLITLFASTLMYILSAFAIQFSSFTLLLFARFLTGFFESNYSLAYTILLETDKNSNEKLPNLEFWTTTVSNVGWILGSLIGWNLISISSLSLTLLSLPFWGACLLYFTCFLLVSSFFKEHKKPSYPKLEEKSSFFVILTSFKRSSLKPILISNMAFFAATSIIFFYTPIFLMKQHNFEPATLGTVDSCLSFSSCFAPFTYWLYSKYYSRKETMCISSFGIAISLLLLVVLPFKSSVWCALFLISYFTAIGFSFSTFLVTDYTPPEARGESLGVNQALFVLIEAVISFLCGLFAAVSFYLPLIIAILCALFSAGWIFYRLILPTTAGSLKLSLQE